MSDWNKIPQENIRKSEELLTRKGLNASDAMSVVRTIGKTALGTELYPAAQYFSETAIEEDTLKKCEKLLTKMGMEKADAKETVAEILTTLTNEELKKGKVHEPDPEENTILILSKEERELLKNLICRDLECFEADNYDDDELDDVMAENRRGIDLLRSMGCAADAEYYEEKLEREEREL